MNGRRRSPAEIRSEIASTRARLAADIDAARMRLSRRGLEHDAMDALRGVRHEASGRLDGLGNKADRQVGQFSRIAVDVVKRYPVVTTLVGLGLALLAISNSNGRRTGLPVRGREHEPEMPLVKPTTAATTTADVPPPRY
ncbi:MAG: DUF3618 domain-containing protein [Trueperaceae bacterium]